MTMHLFPLRVKSYIAAAKWQMKYEYGLQLIWGFIYDGHIDDL